MLFIAVVLDHRYKLEYVNWDINHSYDVVDVDKLKTKVKETLYALYEECSLLNISHSMQSTEESQGISNVDIGDINFDLEDFLMVMYNEERARQQAMQPKSELDKYLAEDIDDDRDKKFDILNCGK